MLAYREIYPMVVLLAYGGAQGSNGVIAGFREL
jgi:hypothetical protein